MQGPTCELLVAETTGAWAPEAAKALDHISRAAGATSGSTLLQEACVLIRTWRARAALRRRAELETWPWWLLCFTLELLSVAFCEPPLLCWERSGGNAWLLPCFCSRAFLNFQRDGVSCFFLWVPTYALWLLGSPHMGLPFAPCTDLVFPHPALGNRPVQYIYHYAVYYIVFPQRCRVM